MDPRTPVIVGAGQVVQRPGTGSLGPIELAVEALRAAALDCGVDAVLGRADSVRHVATAGWQYQDEGALIASALGVSPRETVRTALFGGDGPQRLLGDTAASILSGAVEVALVTSAEAVYSVLAAQKSGTPPPWPTQTDGPGPTRVVGDQRAPTSEAEASVALLAPLQYYSLLECAERARVHAAPDDHLRALGSLWSRFAEVAAEHETAWTRSSPSATEIVTASASNRVVCAPYLKLLTANIQVDQACGLVMCSVAAAESLGVPPDRWVFPWASAWAADEWFMTERAELASSPAIRACGAAALGHTGRALEEVDVVDLYSCFPSAVQIGARELGIDLSAMTPTVTGGLTFFGGPGNGYSLHAVATLVERLRASPSAVGLSTALGWYVTKHACGVYSASPPPVAFADVVASVDAPPARVATASYVGPAVVEAWCAPWSRDGAAEAVIVSALTPDGVRALARIEEEAAVRDFLAADPLGERIELGPNGLA